MAKKNSTFSSWFFDEYESINRSLPIYRVIFSLFVLITLLPRHLWITNYPDTFFFPRIGITFFFTGFPDILFFYVLNFLLIVSLLALLFGYKPFYSSITLAFLLFIGNAWEYSFSKVNHDILLIIIPLLLSASVWGKKTGDEITITEKNTWPITTFALLVSLAMLTAAMEKIISGWLDPSTSALTGHLVRNYFVAEKQTYLATYLLSQNSFYIFKFLDYGTLIIESAFVFTVFSLRYFRLTCALACLFHFGVQITMGISFIPNILAYALFVNWTYLYNYEGVKIMFRKFDNLTNNAGLFTIIMVSLPLWALYTFIGNPFTYELGLVNIIGGNILRSLIMFAAVIISLIYILNILRGKFHLSKVQTNSY